MFNMLCPFGSITLLLVLDATCIPVWRSTGPLSQWAFRMCIFSIESATSGRPTDFVLMAFTRSCHVAFPVFSQVICICRLRSSRFEYWCSILVSFAFGILSWIPIAIHFGSVPWSASWTSARWESSSRNISSHHARVKDRIADPPI